MSYALYEAVKGRKYTVPQKINSRGIHYSEKEWEEMGNLRSFSGVLHVGRSVLEEGEGVGEGM